MEVKIIEYYNDDIKFSKLVEDFIKNKIINDVEYSTSFDTDGNILYSAMIIYVPVERLYEEW